MSSKKWLARTKSCAKSMPFIFKIFKSNLIFRSQKIYFKNRMRNSSSPAVFVLLFDSVYRKQDKERRTA
jgi:hypothetical protein